MSSRLITCYAISPQAVFTCPPCSIRSRGPEQEPAQRYTYCSVISLRPQLICFSEISNAEITTKSINLSKEAAPIVHLDTSHGGSRNKLLALHEDGSVTTYSHDLISEEWHSSINTSVSNLVSVPAIQAAAILSVQQARKTILKSREDVLATFSLDEDAVDHSLLLVITRSTANDAESTLEMRVFHIRIADAGRNGLSSDIGNKLQPLATLPLPQPSHFSSREAQITMHTASGTIYQVAEGALAVYDLTGSVPRLVHTIVREDVFSYLRVSHKLVASNRNGSLSLMDLTYGSLQGEGTLTFDQGAKVAQKSNLSDTVETATKNVRLLSYFAPLDIIVVLDGRKLLALQLFTGQETGGSRKRKRDGLLVNSIGRGSSSSIRASPSFDDSDRKTRSLGPHLSSSGNKEWESQKAALDRCIARNDEKEFENLMAIALGVKASPKDMKVSDIGVRKHVDAIALSYALKSMFSAEQACLDEDIAGHGLRSLSVRFFPKTIGSWLIDNGLLTYNRIQTSLKQSGALPITSKLATGSLVRCLAKLDPSLEILSSLLASPVPLSSQELVHVLAIVTQSPNEATATQQLLTISDAKDESGSTDRSPLLSRQTTDFQPSSLQNLSADDLNRGLLNIAMKRLYACPSSSVAQILKRSLSTLQLRILVDSLRMEIARTGWLSPYENSQEPLELNSQDGSQMSFIAHLLNCVVDSLGAAGWISGNSMSDDLTETADTIAYMKAEISAALEGVEEATYLKGMLGEILLCGKDSLNSSRKRSKLPETQMPDLLAKPKTIVLYEHDSRLLPLGLKLAPAISTTRIGAGGELIRRSMRDIGMLKSKMVGKYSFDRIMI